MSAEETPPIVPPREAIAFFRRKGFKLGFDWRDVWQEEHARVFTVAKAMSIDVLEDIREAVDRAIAEGRTLAQFREELEPLLIARGWWGRQRMIDPETGRIETVQLGSPRRLKTIFDTNMRSAYAAGRWERIQRQKRAFPFLQYRSVLDGREREQHRAWHGTILPVDHEWWQTHYPPCGWNCRCVATPINQRTIERRGLQLTETPVAFEAKRYVNKRTGEVMEIEQGIDPGFNFNIGQAALDAHQPRPLPPGGDEGSINSARLSEADYDRVRGFFAVFGLGSAEAVARGRVWRDATGWPLAIGARLVQRADGAIVAADGLAAGIIAEPDEIRLRWVRDRSGRALLMRRYIRTGAGVVDWHHRGWRWAAGDSAAARQGLVIWTRPAS